MKLELSSAEIGKLVSARQALEFVKPDMKIGLGTGSTAAWLVKLLANAVSEDGFSIHACATSHETTLLAESLGITISSLDHLGKLDLVIDGADEFDQNLNLIKGGGAALLREKIVETATDQLVIITDSSKEVTQLGAIALPVEVIQFGWQTTMALMDELLSHYNVDKVSIVRRGGERPLITDEGHFILDLNLGRIDDPFALHHDLISIAGVVETGLFLNMTDFIIVGDDQGVAKMRGVENQKWHETLYSQEELIQLLRRINNGV